MKTKTGRRSFFRRGNSRKALVAFAYLFLLLPGRSEALRQLEIEEDIAELLPTVSPYVHRPRDPSEKQWAVLPQIGYGPDTDFLAGIKFKHSDTFGQGITSDLGAVYALKRQQSYALSIASPNLLNDKMLLVLRSRYRLDPERKFFGIGNNTLKEGPLSAHAYEELGGAVTLGWRPFKRTVFNFGAGVRHVHIWCDKKDPALPVTVRSFPDLPGIGGGLVNYLKLSVVWNNRDAVTRPTRGWRLILKAIHTNKAILSDYTFTRMVADAGYLRSFFQERLVFGARVNVEWIIGPESDIPFWELSELGGNDTLRGFFPHRFLGKGSVFLNGECRFLLVEFEFLDLWDVRIDAVAFGDGGRVFISGEEVREDFFPDGNVVEGLIEGLRYSYGGGLRFALSHALLARVDVGFSDEETALVYFSFGHTF